MVKPVRQGQPGIRLVPAAATWPTTIFAYLGAKAAQ